MKQRFLLIIIAFMTLLPLRAQLATGSWRQYPVFGEFTDLVDTPDNVWYVTGGCLYRYDKKADETRFYEGGRELSDNTVKLIRYYPAKDMLAVAFNNGNIDLILSDGSRVNCPDIKDAVVNVDKTVNDMVFDGDEMYVATAFGIVIYNLDRFEVKESGIYNTPINTVLLTPKYLVIVPSEHNDWLYELLCVERGGRINRLSNFKVMGRYYDLIKHPQPLNEEHTEFAVVRHKSLGSIRINDDGTFNHVNQQTVDGNKPTVTYLSSSADGVVRFITADGMIGHYTGYGSAVSDATLPDRFKGNMFSTHKGLSSFWLAGDDGLGCYSISDGKGLTVLRDKSRPEGATTFGEVCNIFPSNTSGDFYIANLGMNGIHPVGSGEYYTKKLCLNKIASSDVVDIDPVGATATTRPGIDAVTANGPYIFSPTQVAEDPDYPERLYIGSGNEGLYVVEGDDVVLKFDSTNAPMKLYGNYYYGTVSVTIDRAGNLWVASLVSSGGNSIIVLPAEKRKRSDLSGIKADDWIVPDYEGFIRSRDIKILHCQHSPMIFAIDAVGYRNFLAVNHKGTPGNFSDDESRAWEKTTDQDGLTFQPTQFVCLAEDHRGHVWMGTTSGVISITNPTRACDGDFRINRIKVPRNDGSGLADYLLDTDKVTAIAVDNSNRKWIGTESSGLFLVSEDGDEIISNFTTANSPLPTNTITSLYADPTSSSIFIGTLTGLYEYSSTSGPAKPDYSDVYAYPNPVTPDYTGWITIAGLMDNSLVKIVDSSMNLVYQTVSEGGTAMWDGCRQGGSRVRSGVYYVLASSQDGDSSSMSTSSAGDVVAKILVVN
ncbi:MAG: hypothetical protein K2G27_08130 [Duncaniella sp.]|nr:hypothetical protein [Duncaniella sp.]